MCIGHDGAEHGGNGATGTATIIKNGTIVTTDLTYKTDVAVEVGKIVEIGEGLKSDETLDATGCYVMPGGIGPHTHLEMPLMSSYSRDDVESSILATLSCGTTGANCD